MKLIREHSMLMKVSSWDQIIALSIAREQLEYSVSRANGLWHCCIYSSRGVTEAKLQQSFLQ